MLKVKIRLRLRSKTDVIKTKIIIKSLNQIKLEEK